MDGASCYAFVPGGALLPCWATQRPAATTARRRAAPIVCKKRGGGGGGGGSGGGRRERGNGKSVDEGSRASKSPPRKDADDADSASTQLQLKRPVVSTEGLAEEVDLDQALRAKEKNRMFGGGRGGGRMDDDEWVEWDVQTCGEWQETEGLFNFINSLVPEILQITFPSIAETLKLVVVIIVLFVTLVAFTYTVDGVYLSIARKVFGAKYFL